MATAGCVLLGLPLALLPAASAHPDHMTFEWQEPVHDGGEVEGSAVKIRGRAEFAEGVDRWQVDVLAPEGDETLTDFGTVCEGDGKGEKSVELDCDWDTTERSDGSISPNNAYRIVVTAWNTQPDQPKSDQPKSDKAKDKPPPPEEPPPAEAPAYSAEAHTSPERTVTVANPPKPVENVQLAYDQKNAVVTASWQQNPEPDIAGYLVEERFESGEWALVAKPTTLFWSGHLEKSGTYRYRVAAVRYVGSSTRLKQGPFRQPQSGTTKVEHKAKEDEQPADTTTSSEPKTTSANAEKDKAGKDKDKRDEPEETTSSSTPGGDEQAAVGSVTFTYEGNAPGDPGFPVGPDGTPVLPQPALSPIQPGNPGSVETRYADPVTLPAPLKPEEAFDPGFSMALPYPKEVRLEMTPPVEEPRILGTVARFETDGEQQRALMGVLAGGLCVFVLSMQFALLNRRPRPTELLPASADWD